MLEQLNFHMKETESKPLSHIIHKNHLKLDHILNVKAGTIKLLEAPEEYLYNLE